MNHLNTSLDYYLIPYLKQRKARYHLVDQNLLLFSDIHSKTKTAVIVRYLDDNEFKKLQKLFYHGYRLIYFMDDDLLDENALVGLPKPYVKRIKKRATQYKDFLIQNCDEIWVSSQYLANKYAETWQAVRLITPFAIPELQQIKQPCWVCYHGSASHQSEFEWLAPLVTKLQKETEQIRFELFGDHSVLKQFRAVPRTSVIHPMSWENYLDYTQSVKRDIGLVPLLPDPFNSARSICKFYDLTRMGAVGIYSNVAPYKGFIEQGVDGFLLENNPEQWIKTIRYLVENPEVKEKMLKAAQDRVKKMME